MICIITFIPALAIFAEFATFAQIEAAGLVLIPMGVSVIWNSVVLIAMGKKRHAILLVGDGVLAYFLMKLLIPVRTPNMTL